MYLILYIYVPQLSHNLSTFSLLTYCRLSSFKETLTEATFVVFLSLLGKQRQHYFTIDIISIHILMISQLKAEVSSGLVGEQQRKMQLQSEWE